MYFSPLRYPGGKGRLAPFIKLLIQKTGHTGGTYIEPFAGGAGVAIDLLLSNYVSRIVINDYDKGIYSFWRAILTETDRFVDSIAHSKLTVEEWLIQRDIYLSSSRKYSFELGFATFYLNRTNRSGIIKGGLIGGKKQAGNWRMDARFPKDSLINRIQRIASKKGHIHLYNKDISSFLCHSLRHFEKALIYFDPPYYKKGRELYMNFLIHEDHVRIKNDIERLKNIDWILTYDDCSEIVNLYADHCCRKMKWQYSVASKRTVNEIVVFKDPSMVPTTDELLKANVLTHLYE